MTSKPLPTLLSIAALTLSAAPLVAAQDPILAIDAPENVFELSDSMHVTVHGAGAALQVFLGDAEVTSQVPVQESVDSDPGQLGYDLDLSLLDPTPGQCLLVRASADGSLGPVIAETCTQVVPNVSVAVYASNDPDAGAVVADVVWQELEPVSSLISVLWYGEDITSFVPISGPTTVDEVVVDGVMLTRTERYHLDLSALQGYEVPDGSLELVVFGSEVGGSFTYEAIPVHPELVAPPGLTQCHKDALKKFLDAIGLDKENGATTASADADTLRAAADELKEDLDDCEPRFPNSQQSFPYTDADGDTVDVIIDFSSTGESTASGSADAVIAVGGTGNPEGGDGTATNNKPDGTAIGIGGNGAGGTSNPGDGGDGRGNSRQPGQAIGLGGDGGAANPATGAGGNGGRGSGWRRQGGQGSGYTSGGTYTGSNGAAGQQGNNGSRGGGGWTNIGNGGMSGGSRGPFAQ